MAKKSLSQRVAPPPGTTKAKGDWGETAAAQYLISRGFAIREYKYSGRGFEIDLIAQNATTVAFVEVKTRKDDGSDPVSAVDNTKRQHMVHAADGYLKELGLPLDYEFDIIAIIGDEHEFKLQFIQDAFFPTPRGRR